MIEVLYFIISLVSSTIGGICGVGGGIIIKPVLDATGTMGVSEISFLSGCTVLSMSTVSVLLNRKNKGLIEFKSGTSLSAGAIIGGLLGKVLFDLAKLVLHNDNRLGALQAGLLILLTAGTLIYNINCAKLHTKKTNNIFAGSVIGLVLGMISSFLGIGGGPINLLVLSYFFSMDVKKAAANSLYIIMLSQLSSLILSLAQTIPAIDVYIIIIMAAAGVAGAIIGSRINKKIPNRYVSNLFCGFMVLVIGISIYNFVKFLV